MKHSFYIELFIITLAGLFYFALSAPTPLPSTQSSITLDLQSVSDTLFDTSIRPQGIEHERLAGAILPYKLGLERYGHLPTWNPYLSNGVPLINNAFSYLFNPFHSLPMLMLDPVTASKLAILIALLIAGYNMWALGLVIGLGTVARLTIAILYLANGGISAKFGAGHFQLACSLAWPPLVIAALWWTLHSPKRIAPVAFGLSFALMFYAGNIYYTLHILICCTLVVTFHFVGRNNGQWRLRYDRLIRAITAATFAFGLSALMFFPVWQTRGAVTHDEQEINADGTLFANYSFEKSVENLTQRWYSWEQGHEETMFGAVDFANIGSLPFTFIMAAVILYVINQLWLKCKLPTLPYNRLIYVAFPLALIMMFWAGGQIQPIPWLYANIPLLAEFRFIGRALSIAALWWILLGGIGLDMLWKYTAAYLKFQPALKSLFGTQYRWVFGFFLSIWVFLFIYSASHTPTRIALALRNIDLWHFLDTLRFTSLQTAIQSLFHGLFAAAFINLLLRAIRTWLPVRHKTTYDWPNLKVYVGRAVLLAIIAFGLINLIVDNSPSFGFIRQTDSFAPIYEDIHRLDNNPPFASISLPFSSLTFETYENNIRVWSLSEGWLPAAPHSPTITMGNFTNYPRWLIVERDTDGTFKNSGVEKMVNTADYQLRSCYAQSVFLERMSACFAAPNSLELYELPDALPYAFVVTEFDLTSNPVTLRSDKVQSVNIISYQQDSITLSTSSTNRARQFLVIQEANFPGWQVSIDGAAVQVVTVPMYNIDNQYLGLLAVPIERGEHTITATFTPPGLALGILVFIVTFILITLYLTRRPKQKSPA